MLRKLRPALRRPRARTATVLGLSAAATRGVVRLGGLAFPCALGRSGRSVRKREGDGATPVGRWRLLGVLYRSDRGRRPSTRLPVRPIAPDDGWCDAPGDRNYNRPVKLPYTAGHERLWRDDRLYDLCVVLDYNLSNPVRNAGSAIFLHLAAPGFAPTADEREAYDLADWKALRRLDPAIISIGSHSLTHPMLSGVPEAELETEVRDSRRQLERGLERPVDTFAYPNGDLDPAADACVRRHYRVALRASGGWVKRGVDPYRLPRIAAPSGVLKLARRMYA